MDVRAVRGADVGNDRHLVLCKLRLKLKKLFDSCRLMIPEIKEQFISPLRNRFKALESDPTDDNDSLSANIQRTFLETSQEMLGYRKKGRKEWIC